MPDHTYQYKLQYRVGSTWYYAEATALEALEIAQEAKEIAEDAKDIANDANDRAMSAVNTAESLFRHKVVFHPTAGQSVLHVGVDMSLSDVDLYWNGQLKTEDWTISGSDINLGFTTETDDVIVVVVGNFGPNTDLDCGLLVAWTPDSNAIDCGFLS